MRKREKNCYKRNFKEDIWEAAKESQKNKIKKKRPHRLNWFSQQLTMSRGIGKYM